MTPEKIILHLRSAIKDIEASTLRKGEGVMAIERITQAIDWVRRGTK